MIGAATETVSFYVNGAWEKPGGRTMGPVMNPATGDTIAEVPYATAADIDRAVRAAHEAFLKWRDVPVVDRVQVLYRFKALLDKHADDIAATLTRENGKTTDDARAEVRRMIQMVEVSCGMPSLMMGDSLNDVAQGIDCKTIRQPHRRLRGYYALQFPGDGAHLDVPVRHRLRQHLCPQAIRKSSAHAHSRHRAAARCRPSAGRVESGARRQGSC
jgi:malonate-semialdehyde dehydrogenase (acetylating)/methylmalonate-semialdehyde dehydrogenase